VKNTAKLDHKNSICIVKYHSVYSFIKIYIVDHQMQKLGNFAMPKTINKNKHYKRTSKHSSLTEVYVYVPLAL